MEKWLMIIVMVAVGAVPLSAQEAGRDLLGVREAVELAWQRNPEVNALRQEVVAKRGQWWQSFGISAPVVAYTREGISAHRSTFEEQRWSLVQSFDFPLESYHRLGRTSAEESALEFRLEAAMLRLRADVKRAYTELLYGQEVVHLRTEQLGLASALVEAAGVRVEVGEASELELIRAEIQEAEALSLLEDAQRRFHEARYHLFETIGLPTDEQRYDIAFPDTLAFFDVEIEQMRVIDRIAHQPEMHSAEQEMVAAARGISEVRSSLLPNILVEAYPQDFGSGYDRFGFQVGFRIPLWLVPSHRGRMQEARARSAGATHRAEGVELTLKREAEVAWHGYETSRDIVTRYHRLVHLRSRELLDRTQEGYRIGEIDLITLLDTQRGYLTSELTYYDALRTYYLHLIELERFFDSELVFTPATTPSHQLTRVQP